jgi:hypothetical protein
VELPAEAVIVLNSWAGLTTHRVTVLRETPKRFQVELHAMAFGRSARSPWLIPKQHVYFEKPSWAPDPCG